MGIIAPVTIEMHALWLVKDCVISRENHLARGDFIISNVNWKMVAYLDTSNQNNCNTLLATKFPTAR